MTAAAFGICKGRQGLVRPVKVEVGAPADEVELSLRRREVECLRNVIERRDGVAAL